MSETRTSPGPEGPALQDKKLVSWKEIASHLGREVRTVQRWERSEGLPVYRHEHLRKSTVYAFAKELEKRGIKQVVAKPRERGRTRRSHRRASPLPPARRAW